MTAVIKQQNACTNFKLRTTLQSSVPSLKIKGIPYNPLLPIPPFDMVELVLHKGLAHSTTYQTKLFCSFCLPSWLETQIPEWDFSFGLSNVVVFGKEIFRDDLANAFHGSKQSCFMPVDILLQLNLQIGSG